MRFLRNIFLLIGCILGFSLQSCKDELIIEESNSPVEEVDGDCIGFIMQLDKDLATRSDNNFTMSDDLDKFDNYIDTQDKFRVFFFTEKGDFLFGVTDRIVSSLLNTSDHTVNYWYVRIPMTMIVDRDNQEYDIDKIKKYLKTNRFKVAVLANWPNSGAKINPADWDDSEGTESSSDNPSSTLKGNPRWNWSNSILNSKAKPEDIRNINDLHHVYNDVYYGSASRLSHYQGYMAHVSSGEDQGWYMGEPTDWVKMRTVKDKGGWKYPNKKDMVDVNGNGGFESKEEANKWIRANCTPDVEINQDKGIYRHYQHMWFLWNFDASYKTGENGDAKYNAEGKVTSVKDNGYYEDNWEWNNGVKDIVANPWGAEWYKRNGDALYKWMKNSYNNGTPKAIGPITIDIGESNNDVFFKYLSRNGYPAYCVKVGNNYGIQLPNIGNRTVTTETDGMITFQARTSGTLRVKWGSADGTSSGLGVQVSNTYRNHDNVTSITPINWTHTNDGTQYWDITVEGNSEPVYIFCTRGKAVVYSIEFIRGLYLYETDREGVVPSAEQGIPMYGVQDYEPIGDWQRGTTHNLSENVYLVRALAKVEVYIKKEFGEPKHVYMRNLNRAARCEPMDVHSPTDRYWMAQHKDSKECEWFDIIDHGPSYGNSNYDGWFGWFYGSWKQTGTDSDIFWKTEDDKTYRWNYNLGYYVPDGTQGGWAKGSFQYYEESPHYFNPYLYRCDYCRFLQASEESYDGTAYFKYVLYLPEKNIDDPGTIGNTASTPRVPHIEYRFTPREITSDGPEAMAATFHNTEYNLDDNDCYRIYFTNYGYSTDASLTGTKVNNYLKESHWGRSTYDDYEKSTERLSFHWPIMRNHKYKFFVGGTGPENPEIYVEVNEWRHRKTVVTW